MDIQDAIKTFKRHIQHSKLKQEIAEDDLEFWKYQELSSKAELSRLEKQLREENKNEI